MKKMKLFGIACVVAITSFAQKHSPELGLKGGVNLAYLDMKAGNTDSRTAYHLGALAHLHVNSRFALQPEVVFSSQGAEYSDDRELKLNYLNVPVLGQFMFGNGFRLQTGPQLGFRVNKKSGLPGDGNNLGNTYKNTDFAWSFGTGYLTRSGLGIDARYNLGLTDISKNNTDLKNRVWQLGLFYQFRK